MTTRLAPAPYARPLGPIAAAGWSAAFLLVFAVAIAILSSVRPGSEYDDVNGALLDAASVLCVVYAIARFHAPSTTVRELVGARPLGFFSALAAALMGAAAVVPIGALQELIGRRFPQPESRATEVTHALAGLGRNERMMGVIAALVVVPIVDELLFRGALATGVAKDRGRWVALVTTALTFGVIYSIGDFHHIPVYVALGLMLGLARFATGTVLASIGAHLAWRGADLARDARVAGTIDPLVTATYPYPPYTLPVIAAGTAATLLFALILLRLGRNQDRDGDERQPPGPKAAPASSGDGEDDA